MADDATPDQRAAIRAVAWTEAADMVDLLTRRWEQSACRDSAYATGEVAKLLRGLARDELQGATPDPRDPLAAVDAALDSLVAEVGTHPRVGDVRAAVAQARAVWVVGGTAPARNPDRSPAMDPWRRLLDAAERGVREHGWDVEIAVATTMARLALPGHDSGTPAVHPDCSVCCGFSRGALIDEIGAWHDGGHHGPQPTRNDAETEAAEPVPEVHCPACGATIRARMADTPSAGSDTTTETEG